MVRSDDIYTLPEGLPVPEDDGAARHLHGAVVPDIDLPATDGTAVSLADFPMRLVLYGYPRTGRPDQESPPGWNDIPGARGCTPQACAFRDHYAELLQLGVRVFGLSTQSTDEQREAATRLHLPFPFLSDAGHHLCDAMDLPTFQVGGMRLLKRITMIIDSGTVSHVFYPVFPPDRHAEEVLTWLESAQ